MRFRLTTQPPHHAARGFTLIEVMITVAIIAVIAAVAYPSYMDYMRRSRVAEATGTLTTTRVRLEQYFQDNRNYGSTATTCGVAMPAGKYFSFACNWGAGGTSQSFRLTAAGSTAEGMDGYTFTIDQNNSQQTTAFPDASGLPVNCWLKRKGDTC